MISKKGKRTLVFGNDTFAWSVKQVGDNSFLSISSFDKKTVLSYRVNQISDKYIHPEIEVLQSAKLVPGRYSFFPPLADEVISTHNIRAILNWYEKQVENSI